MTTTLTLRRRIIASLRADGFSRAEICGGIGISGSTYDREIKAMREVHRAEVRSRIDATEESLGRMAARLAELAEE